MLERRELIGVLAAATAQTPRHQAGNELSRSVPSFSVQACSLITRADVKKATGRDDSNKAGRSAGADSSAIRCSQRVSRRENPSPATPRSRRDVTDLRTRVVAICDTVIVQFLKHNYPPRGRLHWLDPELARYTTCGNRIQRPGSRQHRVST